MSFCANCGRYTWDLQHIRNEGVSQLPGTRFSSPVIGEVYVYCHCIGVLVAELYQARHLNAASSSGEGRVDSNSQSRRRAWTDFAEHHVSSVISMTGKHTSSVWNSLDAMLVVLGTGIASARLAGMFTVESTPGPWAGLLGAVAWFRLLSVMRASVQVPPLPPRKVYQLANGSGADQWV